MILMHLGKEKILTLTPGVFFSYIHLHSSPSTGILRTHNVTSSQMANDSSVGRALQQYRRGHGFESHSGLNSFQALISQLLKLCV